MQGNVHTLHAVRAACLTPSAACVPTRCRRAEISAVYAAYSRLLKENGSSDEQEAQQDYQRLLDAGQGAMQATQQQPAAVRRMHASRQQLHAPCMARWRMNLPWVRAMQTGSSAAARLAASLAPRFLHRFPHQLDATASLLMRLATCKARSRHDVESVLESTKADALRGLGHVLELATKVPGQAVQTVLRVVEFLLRCACTATAARSQQWA